MLHLPDKRSVYLAGDTAVFSDMELIEKLYKPDLAFLPVGEFYHGSARSRAGLPLLNVKRVVPMHFGTFPALIGIPAELVRELKDFPHTEVWPLEIGKPVKW